MFFLLSTEGSLVITRAYPALYLGGTPSNETVTSPPSCLLLENRLYMSPISHMKQGVHITYFTTLVQGTAAYTKLLFTNICLNWNKINVREWKWFILSFRTQIKSKCKNTYSGNDYCNIKHKYKYWSIKNYHRLC